MSSRAQLVWAAGSAPFLLCTAQHMPRARVATSSPLQGLLLLLLLLLLAAASALSGCPQSNCLFRTFLGAATSQRCCG
jgi:hypothetical protein